MKKTTLILSCLLLATTSLLSQRKVSEIMLSYDMQVTTGNTEPRLADAFDGAKTIVYIKGNMSRSDFTSVIFSSTIIHDSKTGTAVTLKQVSGQKLLIRMTAENWAEKNKKYEGINFTNTTETKLIAGYKCTKAVAKLVDGTTFVVYYTTDLIPENREYDDNTMFKTLNGLPLEWELTEGKLNIKYTLSKINMNPIPASKFDIPKSGYRELTYEESKKSN